MNHQARWLRRVVAGTVALVCGACAASRSSGDHHGGAPGARGDSSAVVLYESHSFAGDAGVDTLVTWVADGRVRVAHHGGIAILDARRDRFILLDPATHTERSMPLATWEAKLRDAVRSVGDTVPGQPRRTAALAFEPSGDGGSVAGFACARYHLFTTRQLFPGEWEDVEEEIWVSRDVVLSKAALATYERVLESLDWIGLDARVERPPGVTLRTSVRRHSHTAPPGADEIETNEVFRVETRGAPDSIFSVPRGYARAAR